MSHVVGIDLGTTNSCVSVLIDGSPEVIPNKGGYKTTPSVVAISESGRRLVGQMAKRQAITNARHTVYAAKRLIGRKWGSPAVLHSLETCPYEIVQGPHDDVRVKLRDKVYSVPEISSMILQEMRLIAEEYLGEEVTQAVITVPAYFNDGQRQATKDAGRIAGLDVLRIINEPTAAALAYGFGKNLDQTIAIYDLGGGTFDISVLEISDGVFDVLATSGDTFLGGEDFDARIIEWLTFEFAGEYRVDLRNDDMALQRLKDAAEKAKIELSAVSDTEINLPFIYTQEDNEALHLQRTLSRDKLEDLVVDLIQRTVKICQSTLEEAALTVADVDAVILVGGMTRMLAVQSAVAKYFKKDAKKGVHPDEVVAIGAGIQAHALTEDESEVLLLDVTPHSLGIMVYGGGFEVIIEKNSTVPTEPVEDVHDGPREPDIHQDSGAPGRVRPSRRERAARRVRTDRAEEGAGERSRDRGDLRYLRRRHRVRPGKGPRDEQGTIHHRYSDERTHRRRDPRHDRGEPGVPGSGEGNRRNRRAPRPDSPDDARHRAHAPAGHRHHSVVEPRTGCATKGARRTRQRKIGDRVKQHGRAHRQRRRARAYAHRVQGNRRPRRLSSPLMKLDRVEYRPEQGLLFALGGRRGP